MRLRFAFRQRNPLVAAGMPVIQFPPVPVVAGRDQRGAREPEDDPQPRPDPMRRETSPPGRVEPCLQGCRGLPVHLPDRRREGTVFPDRPAQDVGELADGQDRRAGAVGGLPVRHPRQLGLDHLGQPRQVDPVVVVLGDRLPAFDLVADDRTAPGPGQLRPQPPDRVLPAGQMQVLALTGHRAPATRMRTTSSWPRPSAPHPPGPSHTGRWWSARGRGPGGGRPPIPGCRPAARRRRGCA